MALFSKAKSGEGEGAAAERTPQPVKAGIFFDHARTAHDTSNYEYAIQNWLNGLRQDWTSLIGLEGYLRSAQALVTENPKKGISKDTVKAVTGDANRDIDRLIQALLSYGVRSSDANEAVRVVEAAAKAKADPIVAYLGRHAMALLQNLPQAKQRKDPYVKLMEAFKAAQVYDMAVRASELAVKLDPADVQLATDLRNMMAANTMVQGGFNDTGVEGGYKRNIRNLDKQTELEERDRLSKTEDTKAKLVAEAKAAYDANPTDKVLIDRYGRALLEAGGAANELKAMSVYGNAAKDTRDFRFQQKADDIALTRARRAVEKAKADADAKPADAALRATYERMLGEANKKEEDNLRRAIAAYPTDVDLRFRLGRLMFNLQRYDEAIPPLQESQSDPRLRPQVLYFLGRSFNAIGGFEAEAVEILKAALQAHGDPDDDRGMDIRYELMNALVAKAEIERNLEVAEEADKIAGAIAIKRFGFRDIQDRRKSIKELIARLRAV